MADDGDGSNASPLSNIAKMRTSWHNNCWRHRRGAFNNEQGWEAATEVSGGGADRRTMMPHDGNGSNELPLSNIDRG